MSKLLKKDKFFDLSDYGRPVAKLIANTLKSTSCTAIHVTLMFGVSGMLAVWCILTHHYLAAAFFLVLKSILDAADGELSRVKNSPSYVGRYLDSIFDIILNLAILLAIQHVSHASMWLTFTAFICLQMQGTLYNYYYVILRNALQGGDKTSKIFESQTPLAFAGESQKAVNISFAIFNALYSVFDKAIYNLDKKAVFMNGLPNWFMTCVSTYGLGFQLLLIAIMLPLGLVNYIIPFFVGYSILLFVIVGIRKFVLVPNVSIAA
jgi:phosphatidylglycerophosphate synthase